MRREAHSLKSSTATFGLSRLSSLSKTIEMACRSDDHDTACSALRELTAQLTPDLALLDAHID